MKKQRKAFALKNKNKINFLKEEFMKKNYCTPKYDVTLFLECPISTSGGFGEKSGEFGFEYIGGDVFGGGF